MAEKDRLKWNERYREEEATLPASPFLAQLTDVIPRRGRALDVAGGSGRNGRWLMEHGLDVTVADISEEGLARAASFGLSTVRLDFDLEPLPEGPWDVILCNHFLHRPLFAAFPDLLAPGGWLLVAIATAVNLERHAHPSRQYLLEPGELVRLAKGLEVVSCTEGWVESGWHEARLVARRR
jgi:SAM-dependent methyltransferase